MIPTGFILDPAPALNQIDDQHHDGDDQQQMNERTTHVADEAEEPEYE